MRKKDRWPLGNPSTHEGFENPLSTGSVMIQRCPNLLTILLYVARVVNGFGPIYPVYYR